MNKPTFKGEIETRHDLVFGDISVKLNKYGNYEIDIHVDETHITKYYQIIQRNNNTINHLKLVIALNEDL